MTKTNTIAIGDLTVSEVLQSGVPTGKWQIDIPARLSPTGKRRRTSRPSKTTALRDARAFVKRIELEADSMHPSQGRETLNEVFPVWLESEKLKMAAGKKRQISLANDLANLGHVLDHLGEVAIGKIDEDRILRYQAARVSDGLKAVTINTETRKLRLILGWCFRKRLIDMVPQFTPLEEDAVVTEVPTLQEVLSILGELPKVQRVLIRLMIETGLRVSEAMNLRWVDVDLDRRMVRVGGAGARTPKTQFSNREVSIGDGLAVDLLQVKSTSQWVFPSPRDISKPMTTCKKSLKAAVLRSGVQRYGEPMRFTPKFARKAFTSYQWIQGTPFE